MKLQVLCDCDDNKVCTGNFDGKPMWHYKKSYPTETEALKATVEFVRSVPKHQWNELMKEEAYEQNSN